MTGVGATANGKQRSFMRRLLMGLMLLGLAAPILSGAQPRIFNVAFLRAEKPLSGTVEALRDGLRDQGYIEGKNLTLHVRWADGSEEKLKALVTEIVKLKVDVIVTSAPAATSAAMASTATIPIVMVAVADPVSFKFVPSLARPGGNVTGFAYLLPELSGKPLEILKEAMPHLTRVAVLWNAANPYKPLDLKEVQAVADAMKIRVLTFPVRSPTEFRGAFRNAVKQGAQGVITLEDPFTTMHRSEIVGLAREHKLPGVYGLKPFADAGGLMAYGPEPLHQYRRAALVIDRILHGAKPGDIPVEQPTKFEFVINQKTARTMGFNVPRAMVLRADYVLE